MARFDAWLAEQESSVSPDAGYTDLCGGAASIPVPQEDFDSCMSHWAALVEETSVLSRNGVVQIMFIPFTSRVRFNDFYDVLNDEWHLIEDWTNSMNEAAPDGVAKMFVSSADFWWYDTNGQMFKTAYGSAILTLGAAAAVILIASRSVVLTLFSTVTIGFILTSVTAMLVAIGWTLGFLESICFAILIGVSVDFVIHISYAYSYKDGNVPRGDRTKYALLKVRFWEVKLLCSFGEVSSTFTGTHIRSSFRFLSLAVDGTKYLGNCHHDYPVRGRHVVYSYILLSKVCTNLDFYDPISNVGVLHYDVNPNRLYRPVKSNIYSGLVCISSSRLVFLHLPKKDSNC